MGYTWLIPLLMPSPPGHRHIPSLTQLCQQAQVPSEAASVHEQTVGEGSTWRALRQAWWRDTNIARSVLILQLLTFV